MIQLPEVEIVRRDLERDIVGRKIKDVTVNVAKTVKRSTNKTKFAAALVDAKVSAVNRVGRYILISIDPDATLVIHMGEDAQLLRTANKDKVDPKTSVIIGFTQHGQLRLVDFKGDAQMFVVSEPDTIEDKVPELAELGFDALALPMSWTDFGRMVLSHRVKLKSFLTDESVMVGLGDVYSDEILFNSGLRYDRMSDSLNTQELRRFYRGVVETLHDAVKYRGTTLDGTNFVDPEGNAGTYQDHLQVYGRHGELSPRSRRPLVRTKYAGRWTYYCDQSQV